MGRKREARVRPWLREAGKRPYVLGHRGARHAAPENTFLAFELARAEGADGIELDVRTDRDGRVIVLHDRTLARVSGGVETRAADALGGREIQGVDVGRGERVPLLSDVLAWAREGGMRVNVELKSDTKSRRALLAGVAHAVQTSGVTHELVLFSSFHPLLVSAVAWLLPGFPRAWLIEAKQRLLGSAPGFRALGADGVNPQASLVNERHVAHWKKKYAPVTTWTVNDVSEAKRLAALGVDTIISDEPGKILRALVE